MAVEIELGKEMTHDCVFITVFCRAWLLYVFFCYIRVHLHDVECGLKQVCGFRLRS